MMPCISSLYSAEAGKPLIINLHWEISFYTGLIFFDRNIDENIYSRKLVEKGIGAIIDCTMNRDWDGLRSTLFAFPEKHHGTGY